MCLNFLIIDMILLFSKYGFHFKKILFLRTFFYGRYHFQKESNTNKNTFHQKCWTVNYLWKKKKNQFSKSFATIKVYINSVLFKFQTLKTLTNFVFKEFNYFLKRFRMVSYFPYRIWSHCLKLDIETPKSHLQRYLKLEW